MSRDWPAVSVTVLAHRSAATSVACVRSVLDDGYAGAVEVLVREQGGDDVEFAALAEVAARHPEIVVERGPNLGFCDGHERLLRSATGEVLVLLNADALLRPGFLAAVVEALDDPTVGSVQGVVHRRDAPGVVDVAGLDLHRSRAVTPRSRGCPVAAVAPGEIWGAEGAVLVLRRAAVDDARDDVGRLFPAEFGSYKEDVELAWRLRRLGWRCVLAVDAQAEHDRGTDDPAGSVRARLASRRERAELAHVNGFVNLRLARLRHERLGRLLADLPWWLPRELATWAALAATPRAIPAVLVELRRRAPASWRARRAFRHRIRVVDDDTWMRRVNL